ncbi:protein SUPPRESSOR OF QUENCHING 1, chloroplastic [Sesamum angolense]|uniref:Protein SUPPRESSOR OF QUENCHING 1, chloroplastic n=1 Tax=Sesamum angolense TaxID=2727404 RepID=A0AAE2BPQ4_9LAMI|nr:protein SUPPRESSOR OF QUENCHING 1, chloroplastic [Sesamum angolense]
MGKNRIVLLVILMVFLAGCSSVSASPAARIVSGMVTNVVSTIFKRLWSLKSTSKTATSSRSMMKFEGGYTVETVFDGSKLGIEPYSVEVSATGEVLVLDSESSNIYKISNPLSRYSRPKLLAGSAEGYTGHVDGKLREARMNHPKGLAVDDNGNVYVADTMNMAIRKISDTGVVTIAGGKVGRGGGHVDGPSEDAKFSDDFDVVYIGSSCSLLVIDRGNQAIREIQLHEEDCSPQEDSNLHLGMAVLAAACFFGYMLALLQRRMLFPNTEPKAYAKAMPPAPYQKPPPKSVRPPLIPTEEDYDKEEEGLFSSLGRLFVYTGSSIVEIFSGLFSGFRKKPFHHHMQQHHHHPSRHGNAWPVQESFVIPREDEPPQIDTREPTPRKSYPIMTKEMEKTRQSKQSRPYYSGWNGDYQQQPQRHVQQLQHHQHHQKHHPPGPQTYYEQQNCETNEIVFGAVQEQDGRREAMVIKAVDYGDPIYNNQNIRPRSYNYMSYSYGY